MKILQITHRYAPDVGGVETYVQAISEQFVAQGHNVTVLAMSPDLRDAVETEENGVRILRLPSIGFGPDYQFPVGLLRFLRHHSREFDVVHAHNYHASPLLLAAIVGHSTLILTPHLNDRPHSRFAGYLHRPYKLIGRWALHRADAIVCDSETERRRIELDFGLASAKVCVVPLGVSAETVANPQLQHERDPFLILYVGRLVAYKQVDRLIASVESLPEPFHLVIVGDGPDRATLSQQVTALRLERRVSFGGRISDGDLRDMYRRARVVANLSLAEAFGLSVLEAVASGCSVICNDIPAFQELAANFPHHIRLQSDLSPRSLAAGTQRIAGDPLPPLPDMTSYTWGGVSRQLHATYSKAIAHSRSNRDGAGRMV